jgi:death-on-curing protein
VRYLVAEQVLFIHSRLIGETGGIHGIRDLGLLQSAVSRSQATFVGKELYRDVFYKAAALMESIIKNHAFIDGNKRTAITSASIFLLSNSYSLETSQKEFEQFTLKMVTGKVSFDDAVKWFKENSVKQHL